MFVNCVQLCFVQKKPKWLSRRRVVIVPVPVAVWTNAVMTPRDHPPVGIDPRLLPLPNARVLSQHSMPGMRFRRFMAFLDLYVQQYRSNGEMPPKFYFTSKRNFHFRRSISGRGGYQGGRGGFRGRGGGPPAFARPNRPSFHHPVSSSSYAARRVVQVH